MFLHLQAVVASLKDFFRDVCAEKLPIPQKEKFFLTEALKKFEDVHGTPVDVGVEEDAKSESSLFAQKEKALATMYIEDDPDNP